MKSLSENGMLCVRVIGYKRGYKLWNIIQGGIWYKLGYKQLQDGEQGADIQDIVQDLQDMIQAFGTRLFTSCTRVIYKLHQNFG